jgi:hypothetical protein
MNVTDEMLMAYADGELDADTVAAVDRELAANPLLAAKLEKHRALRARLSATFDPILNEAVPERLSAAIRSPASVTNLTEARASRIPKREPSGNSRRWMQIAASVALGVLVGYLAFNTTQRSEAPQVATENVVGKDGRVVNKSLMDALTKGTAAIPQDSARAQVGVSYKSKSGEYCRSFSLKGDTSFAGVACNAGTQAENWRIQMLMSVDAAGSTSGTTYRQATTVIPPAVLAVIDRDIEGEPLDAEQEAKAIAVGWKLKN